MGTKRYFGAAFLMAVVAALAGWAFWPTGGSARPDPVQDVPPAQSETLDSLGITKAAYNAGMRALRECVAARGIAVGELRVDGRGLAAFDLPPAPDRESIAAVRDIWQECYFEHLDDIDRLYQQSPEFQREAIERGWEVLRCLAAEKPGFDTSADQRTLTAAVQGLDMAADPAFQRCFSGVAAKAVGAAGQGGVQIAYTPLPR